MRRRRLGSLAVTSILVCASLAAAPSASAERIVLPLTAFEHMLVDHQHGHVLLTAGTPAEGLVVTDLHGGDVREIEQTSGASAMALVGNDLFVAVKDSPHIYVLDRASLMLERTIELPRAATGALAYAAGKVWVALGTCDEDGGTLTSVDPATGEVEVFPVGRVCPLFRTSPLYPHLLFVSSDSALDMSVEPPRLVGRFDPPSETSHLDFTIADHGATALLAAPGRFVAEYRMSDLRATGLQYPSSHFDVAVAQTSAGEGFVAINLRDPEVDIRLYPEGNTTPVAEFGFDEVVMDRGLAFVPKTGMIFAVTSFDDSEEMILQTFEGPAAQPSGVDVEASDGKVRAGSRVSVTARLDAPEPDPSRLTIYAQPYGGNPVELVSREARGGDSISARTVIGRNTSIFAHWAGTPDVLPATSPASVVQVRMVGVCDVRGGAPGPGRYRVFDAGTRVQIRGGVIPKRRGVRLRFISQRRVGGKWRASEAEAFTTEAGGSVEVVFVAPRPGDYRVATRPLTSKYDAHRSPWRYLRMKR